MSGKRERGISYTPTVKLNAGTGDATAGGAVSLGTGADLYGGLAGIEIEFQDGTVYSDTTIGTLYRGVYKRVKVLSTGGAGIRGKAAFWSDANNAVVTATPQDGNHAGIFLNAVTAGKWCWIQVGGLASVLFASVSLSKATPAIKDVVVVTSGAAVADVEADSTPYTNLIYKRILGIAEAPPVAGTITIVELLDRFSSPDK